MILERYLGGHLLKGYILVLLVLVALFCFLDLVDELSEVGKGQYRIADAFLYVFSTIPTKLLEFSPVCILIGGGYALASLVRGSELLAMRAAGMGVSQIALALLKATLIVALGLMVIAQLVAPRSLQWGEIHRQQALAGEDALRTEHGFWSRDRMHFMSVASLMHGRLPSGINIYELAEDGRLLTFIHAERATILSEGNWLLHDVTVKTEHAGMLKTQFKARQPWRAFLNESQLKILELSPETLTLSELWGYVHHLRASGQLAENYALLFWQRVFLPLSLAVMVPLLIPLIVTSPRAPGFGLRVVIAILIGVLYFLVARVIGSVGLLLDFPPWLTALLPPAATLLLALSWLGKRLNLRF